MELCDSTLKEWINHRNNSPCEGIFNYLIELCHKNASIHSFKVKEPLQITK